ncbi:MAG: Ig-like domain-containing protein [Patescibacteria group bacterium]
MKQRFIAGIVSLIVVTGLVFGATLPAYAALGTPSNLTIVGGQYTNDTTPTFTWNRPSGATWYEFLIDNGEWQSLGNVGRYTTGSLSNGWHTFYVRAHDNSGQISVSTSITFEIDTVGPTVSKVTPTTAKTGVLTTFFAKASGEATVTACWLYVDAVKQGQMFLSPSGYTSSVTFTTTGSHTAYVRCVDGDKNYSSGSTTAISVTKGSAINPGIVLSAGTLIKPMCQNSEPKVGTCHSVYYYGKDGTTHAFPLESIYKSWYGSSFSNVQEIETWQFNRLAIGENVTIRPGTSLVKFSGSTTVYAVEKGGVLRAIVNEAVAKAIYGSRWNSMIVTLPGTVKSDYSYGEKIDSASDYSKTKAYYSVKTVEDNF